MLEVTNKNSHGMVEFACNSTDVTNGELDKIHGVKTGSTCLIVDTSDVYFYDNELDQWIKA